MQFHHRKPLMEQIRRREHVPYIFHMCWYVYPFTQVLNPPPHTYT